MSHRNVDESQYFHLPLDDVADDCSEFLIILIGDSRHSVKYQVVFLVHIEIEQFLLDFLQQTLLVGFIESFDKDYRKVLVGAHSLSGGFIMPLTCICKLKRYSEINVNSNKNSN